MNPISAPVQKPAPRSDRDIAAHNPDADPQTASGAERRRDFHAALREAAGAPAASRGQADSDTDTDTEADAEAPHGRTADPAAGTGPAAPPAGPATSAMAALASLLNTALPAAAGALPAALPATGVTDGATPAPDGAAGTAASATAVTGPHAGVLAGTGPGVRGDARTVAAQEAAAAVASAATPAVAVLDRAVHFKPVLASAARPDPTRPDPVAAPTADAAKAQPLRATLPDLVAAAARVGPKVPPQPELRPADAAAAAAPASDKADLTVRVDSRAVTGIVRAVLDADGHPEAKDASAHAAEDGTGPGLPAATLTTLASAIRDEADRVAEAAPASRVQGDPAVRAAPDGPLRVLRIQLRPEELGTVTVELRLANGQLETHLRAARPETAALLHRDSAILTDLLKQAHYQAEVTVGQARPSDGGGSSGGSPAQGQPTFGQGGARPGQGGERQRQAEQHRAADRRDGERIDETIRPRDGSVYL